MIKLAIQPEHLAIVKGILQREIPQYTVWAFGSRVKNTAKPYSDLDLVIISEQPLNLATLANLSEAFSESDLPWEVDMKWILLIGQPQAVGLGRLFVNSM